MEEIKQFGEVNLTSSEQKTNVNIKERTKEKQGLDFWAKSLFEAGRISQEVYDDFIFQNNHKEEGMRKFGLPQLRHYGLFNSIDDIKEKLLEQKNEHFIIRCKSKEMGEVRRLIDGSLDEICKFGEELPGGFASWTVEVKEYCEPIMAGTIIVSPSGKTNIETWKGPHYLNVTDCQKFEAEFNPDAPDMHFNWTGGEGQDLQDGKEYAVRALKYIFPHLKPKESNPIYTEYCVKPTGEIFFIDVNTSPILTGKRPAEIAELKTTNL
ncbi:MAG: hypothetical protein WC764_00150 [Candidatus Paceibacterota bacterium]|jgi:hypothetical protein